MMAPTKNSGWNEFLHQEYTKPNLLLDKKKKNNQATIEAIWNRYLFILCFVDFTSI